MLRDFFIGMREFRLSFTTRCADEDAYDLGREWAHRLTLRIYETRCY